MASELEARKEWEVTLQMTSEEFLLLLEVLEKRPGGRRLIAHVRALGKRTDFRLAEEQEPALEAAMRGLIPARDELDARRRESRKRARATGQKVEEADVLDIWRERGDTCVRYGSWAMEWYPPQTTSKTPSVSTEIPPSPESPLPEPIVVKREDPESSDLTAGSESVIKKEPAEPTKSPYHFTLRYSPIESPSDDETWEVSETKSTPPESPMADEEVREETTPTKE